MSYSTARLEDLISSISGLSEGDKSALCAEITVLKKELEKSDFKLSRTIKDRKIAENVLNNTIRNLEEKQGEIELMNRELSGQKEELNQQKNIIEEKSIVLEENLHKLELSYREMEKFTYIASHDLKSPLRTISCFAQLLKRKNYEALSEEGKEYVDFIIAGAKQMNEVICDTLEYSKVGTNDEQFFTEVDLNKIISSVRFNLKAELEENSALILHKKLPTIQANRSSILQLFQNLIGNAIKFRSEADPVIRISYDPIENGYQFKVADNGLGIDETYQHKAFQLFQRLDNQHKPGSGIGLAICEKVVKMHGGDIRFESKPRDGTVFIFTLFSRKKAGKQE